MGQRILVADIGGTNARFGIAERVDQGKWTIENFIKFQGDDYPTFKGVLKAYLEPLGDSQPKHAIFSVAGPVADGKVKLTNRDWSLDAEDLAETFAFERALIVNDFAAMTRCVPELEQDDFLHVKDGTAQADAPVLVAGPGTGFGVGYLVPVKKGGWQVITTEGGHQAYAPQTDRELELLKNLREKFGFVSLEKVSSGSGMDDVHEAICKRHGVPYKLLSPAVIMEKAKRGDAVSLELCEIRASATMGAMGDMALSGGARGGVVLAGGVSERMIEFLRADDAMSRFLNRGKRSDYMEDIPIRLLVNSRAALYGAAALYEDYANLTS